MERKNVAFEQLSDIMAFRVTVGSVADCYAALGALHGAYHTLPGRFKDYISTPKSNGYRSLHTTIIGPENRKIEIQIRTARCTSRPSSAWPRTGPTSRRRDTEGRQYRWIRELLDILEHAAGPRSSSSTRSSRCSRTRCSASRRRATS
jgi:GTP pyrophosphokinase